MIKTGKSLQSFISDDPRTIDEKSLDVSTTKALNSQVSTTDIDSVYGNLSAGKNSGGKSYGLKEAKSDLANFTAQAEGDVTDTPEFLQPDGSKISFVEKMQNVCSKLNDIRSMTPEQLKENYPKLIKAANGNTNPEVLESFLQTKLVSRFGTGERKGHIMSMFSGKISGVEAGMFDQLNQLKRDR